jgi:hypothetical protein
MKIEEGAVWSEVRGACMVQNAAFSSDEADFTSHSADLCPFHREEPSGRVFMLFHVEIALVAGCNTAIVEKAKADLAGASNITDLKAARFYLVIKIVQSSLGLHLHQADHCNVLV